MWNTKEMSQQDAALTGVLLTFAFDLGFSRSNCISGMGGPIVMERKGWESIGCPDVKDDHYVTSRQRKLLGTTDRGDLSCRRFRRLIMLILVLKIWSDQKFVHVMTVQLLWHLQNCDLISYYYSCKSNVFFPDFNYESMKWIPRNLCPVIIENKALMTENIFLGMKIPIRNIRC